MSWLVVGLLLLVAFGPVVWLVPSRRDRALARMRARARSLGVIVELVRVDDPAPAPEARVSAGGKRREPKLDGVAYRLPLPQSAALAPAWSVVRAAREAGPAELPGWQWTSTPAGDPAYWRDVAQALSGIPDDVFACETARNAVSLVWREKAGETRPEAAVDALVVHLRELARIQRAHHVARETELERQRFEERAGEKRSS